MAAYKYSQYLHQSDSAAFDDIHQPGKPAPYAGIYSCTKCGHEIGIAEGHILPPQSHPQHPASLGAILWRLIVFAQHNKA